MAALDRYKTVVRNTSGSARFFAFLPPHGRTIAAGDDVHFKGDLFAWFMRDPRDSRDFDSFQTAVAAGSLTIVQTPTVAQFQTSGGDVREIVITGGSVTAVAPAYGSYTGSAPTFS